MCIRDRFQIVSQEGDSRKIYRALGGESMYYGPKVPEHPPFPVTGFQKLPTHLGSNGMVYSGLYEPMTELECYNTPEQYAFDPNHPVFKQIPNASDYESFFAFEQALLKWKTEAQLALNGISLPQFLGRTMRRPLTNRKHLLEMSQTNTNEEEEGEEQVTVQRIILEQPLWDSVLIPEEPIPKYFDHFEDYERAMVKWIELVNEMADIIPPHASQLKDMIPIQSVADKKGPKHNKAKKAEEDSDDTTPKKTTLKFVVPFFEPMEIQSGPRREKLGLQVMRGAEVWKNLSEHTKQQLVDIFLGYIQTKFGLKLPKLINNFFSIHSTKRIVTSNDLHRELSVMWEAEHKRTQNNTEDQMIAMT
eukprot:TRINITY_DN5209_c0_g1_i2.p1 TRINITY_DN5209_c0_g1~~TRINITY_DN5209_c0_g1_i2.p1  ORF type:complete len:361 (+),score=78.94 TRINITY_DN5209_c0_g1_i2:26-1108(+)